MPNAIPIINSNNKSLSVQVKSGNSIGSNVKPVINVQKNPTIQKDKIIIQTNGNGVPGPPGPAGNGILKIEKTKTEGIIDTYTIFFTNGEIFEYEITNGVIYYYDGPYEVTPMANTSQILKTNALAMSDDVTVHEIPYSEVSNLSGGLTATIGE